MEINEQYRHGFAIKTEMSMNTICVLSTLKRVSIKMLNFIKKTIHLY